MARTGTPLFDLGMYPLGENPGAGPVQASEANPANLSKARNGDQMKTELAMSEHNTDGTHRDDKINGNSLKNSIVDGSTLEASAATGAKVFRVKDLGIATGKIAAAAVTTAKIAALAVTSAELAAGAVTTSKITDLNVTTGKLADDAVTPAKISHDNLRTKFVVPFTFDATDLGTYSKLGGKQTTATFGIILPRACSLTRVTVCSSDGATDDESFAYGSKTFALGDRFTLYMVGDGEINGNKNGASMGFPLIGCTTADVICLVEFENDDA